MKKRLLLAAMAAATLAIPNAKADLLFVGSQAGKCCFSVDLKQVSATDVLVEVTLESNAQYFAHTGSGQHPGFAFNILNAPAISITNLSSPWVQGDVHLTSVTTGGPALGTYDFFIDNPGNGSNAHNDGPLKFDVNLAAGISVNDFVANANGYFFVADIQDATGATGLSAINARGIDDGSLSTHGAVPEPSSIIMLGSALFVGCTVLRKKLVRS